MGLSEKPTQWTDEHQALAEKLTPWIQDQALRDLVVTKAHEKFEQMDGPPEDLSYWLSRTLRSEFRKERDRLGIPTPNVWRDEDEELWKLVRRLAKWVPAEFRDTVISDVWEQFTDEVEKIRNIEHWMNRAISRLYKSAIQKNPLSGRSTLSVKDEDGKPKKPTFVSIHQPNPDSDKSHAIQLPDSQEEKHDPELLWRYYCHLYFVDAANQVKEQNRKTLEDNREALEAQGVQFLLSEQWEQRALGAALNESEVAHVKKHLATCPECTDTFRRIGAHPHLKKIHEVTKEAVIKSLRVIHKLPKESHEKDWDEIWQQLEPTMKELAKMQKAYTKECRERARKRSKKSKDLA